MATQHHSTPLCQINAQRLLTLAFHNNDDVTTCQALVSTIKGVRYDSIRTSTYRRIRNISLLQPTESGEDRVTGHRPKTRGQSRRLAWLPNERRASRSWPRTLQSRESRMDAERAASRAECGRCRGGRRLAGTPGECRLHRQASSLGVAKAEASAGKAALVVRAFTGACCNRPCTRVVEQRSLPVGRRRIAQFRR